LAARHDFTDETDDFGFSRPDDLASYLNGEVLVAVWPELFLPKGLRRAWEDRHRALRAARLAAA